MRFQSPLVPARLLRRYKRFLADVRLESDGREVTVHCPNPGAMTGLDRPGMRVWLEPARGKGRKLPFGWRLVELGGGHLAGIDTQVPNRVVAEALADGRIPALLGHDEIRREVRLGDQSRIDFLLCDGRGGRTWVEVKNVHLRREGPVAEFPDCVTKRGARHLDELARVARSGARAVLLFVVQRSDCTAVRVAGDIDPAYLRAFEAARDAGVEVVCHETELSTTEIRLGGSLPLLAPVRPAGSDGLAHDDTSP